MKNLLKTLWFTLMITLVAVGCTAPVASSTEPAEGQDAINTAVAGTLMASALAQATVNSITLTTMPATPTPGPAVEYVNLSEEELAALIDEAVAEAVAATEQATSAVTDTTTDSAVTTEEVAYVSDYYDYADYYVEYAEDLLDEYYALYSDLAYEMMAELNSIETELAQLNDTLTSIDSSLQEISSTLEQGLAVAEESIAQLEAAAEQAQQNAQELKSQAQDMVEVFQADQQARIDQLSQIQPNNIPTDKLTSLQSAFTFLDAANTAMGDNKLSRDELRNIAQLGKNAQAGLQNFGGADALGPDISQFAGRFDEITSQFARGQIPQARGNLGQFETSLGARPDFSGIGGGGLPGGGPGRP